MPDLMQYHDPLLDWKDPSQYDLGNVFIPSTAGNAPAPKDTLADNLWKGLKSIGSATVNIASKTADLFVKNANPVLQAKGAWETIFQPENQRPSNPVAQSQLPSLQGAQDTSRQFQNWVNLRSVLDQIFTPRAAANISLGQPAGSSVSPVLVIGVVLLLTLLIVRTE